MRQKLRVLSAILLLYQRLALGIFDSHEKLLHVPSLLLSFYRALYLSTSLSVSVW